MHGWSGTNVEGKSIIQLANTGLGQKWSLK